MIFNETVDIYSDNRLLVGAHGLVAYDSRCHKRNICIQDEIRREALGEGSSKEGVPD